MASKGIPSGIRALARIANATRAPTRPTSSRAQALLLSTPATKPAPPRTPRLFTRPLSSTPTRHEHSAPKKPQAPEEGQEGAPAAVRAKPPTYELTFTCVPCGTRSAHNVSKQGYHHGSVLITCPSCRNRHVISDHLDIFGARKVTVEELMRERGRLVKRGTLGEDGDIEFWEDGSTTSRAERQGEGMDPKPKERSPPAGAEGGDDDAPGSSFGKA